MASFDPIPPDPRDVTVRNLGTPTRDAAVDPVASDFLAPVNAGLSGAAGNPHGPNVISPGIHNTPDRPVLPGPVSDDGPTQDTAERNAAAEYYGVTVADGG